MTFPVLNFRAPAWKPLALVSALSTIFVSSAYAQVEDVKTLAPVVVTAARIEQPQAEALPHTTVITKEMIRERQATDIVSLLRSEAGIEIVQSGGAGMQSSLFMRGTNSNQNLILIDGVPIRDATSIGSAVALEHILPDQIERIEIVRGNVSAIYGSGAIGGVIQIFTKRGSGTPAFNVMAEAGSRGTTKVGGSVSGQSGDTRYALSVSRFGTDGFSTINTKQFTSENPDKDGDRNVSVAAAVSHEWSKGNELGARIYSYDAKFSHDGGGWGSPTQIDEGKSKQKTLSVFSKNRFLPNWLSTVTVSESEVHRGDISVGGFFGDSETRFKSNTSLLQWANEVMLSSNWMMTAGLETARERADLYSDYGFGATQDKYSRNNTSTYFGLNGKIDAHSLQMNLRHDNVGSSGSDTTWYLGYGYALTPQWKIIASSSTAFLAPTLYQLYDASYGNSSLKAERARSHEAGVQYASGSTLIRATLFESHTRDQIGFDYSTWRYINIDQASNRGLELSAGSRIADVDVRASLTLQHPTDDTTGDALLRRAKTRASLALSKSFGAWRVGADVQYVGRRVDTTGELPSYVLANLNARYKVSKETSLYARVENLFNREFQTVYGYNQAPRGVFAGIEWRQ